jgi:hypothetical protein
MDLLLSVLAAGSHTVGGLFMRKAEGFAQALPAVMVFTCFGRRLCPARADQRLRGRRAAALAQRGLASLAAGRFRGGRAGDRGGDGGLVL